MWKFSCLTISALLSLQPECIIGSVSQIHLSLSGDPSIFGLDYVSEDAAMTQTEYKLANDTNGEQVYRATSKYSYLENIGHLHNTAMDRLLPTSRYEYRIGDGGTNWSEWMPFATGPYVRPNFQRKNDADGLPGGAVAAVYADMGLYNGLSVNRLLKEASLGIYDYAIHIGDIAYDLFSDNSAVGNEYMGMMEPATQQYPVLVGEGNHEKGDNFTEYNLRFKAIETLAGSHSGSHTNHYYSFDEGLIHYIMISTEVYLYATEAANGPSSFTAEEQLAWLEADLQAANTASQRENVPWIVLMGHRPWYTADEGSFRDIDALACAYGVDLYITGHVHNYQRWLPMRTSSPIIPDDVDMSCLSDDMHLYTNPKYMATVVAGSTGCHSPVPRVACPVMAAASKVFMGDSLAFCSAAYGFGHLQAVNSTHLYWEFVQSHRAANINDPNDVQHKKWAPFVVNSNKDEKDIVNSYSAELTQKGVGEYVFLDSIRTSAKSWLEDEIRRDDEVEKDVANSGEQSTQGSSGSTSSSGGSRLVRDYLWIEQHSHGIRNYC